MDRLVRGFRVGTTWFAFGLIGGMAAPLIIATDSNQGPLLGLLVTGPVAGVIGFAWGLMKREKFVGTVGRISHSEEFF